MGYAFDKIPSVLPTPFAEEDAKSYHGFRGRPVDKIWYGVEIELEYTKNIPNAANNHAAIVEEYEYGNEKVTTDIDELNTIVGKFSILKYDGSLTKGVEIATAPCSYEVHLQQWKPFYKKFNSLPFQICNSCGMHVHVSRKRLTENAVNNIRSFIKNSNHRKAIEFLAGRSQSGYCVYTFHEDEVSHYDAVNIENDHTIEFRLFRAPETYEQFVRNLQFVKAVVDFSRSPIFKNDFAQFKKFIYENEYGELRGKSFENGFSDPESKKLAQQLWQ
jgi:hypothetical protein